jgi:hypothetical protein
MTAYELLELMRLGCYSITIVNNNQLDISPAFSIDEEMAELITLHKAELIEILNAEAGGKKEVDCPLTPYHSDSTPFLNTIISKDYK